MPEEEGGLTAAEEAQIGELLPGDDYSADQDTDAGSSSVDSDVVGDESSADSVESNGEADWAERASSDFGVPADFARSFASEEAFQAYLRHQDTQGTQQQLPQQGDPQQWQQQPQYPQQQFPQQQQWMQPGQPDPNGQQFGPPPQQQPPGYKGYELGLDPKAYEEYGEDIVNLVTHLNSLNDHLNSELGAFYNIAGYVPQIHQSLVGFQEQQAQREFEGQVAGFHDVLNGLDEMFGKDLDDRGNVMALDAAAQQNREKVWGEYMRLSQVHGRSVPTEALVRRAANVAFAGQLGKNSQRQRDTKVKQQAQSGRRMGTPARANTGASKVPDPDMLPEEQLAADPDLIAKFEQYAS